MSRSLLSLFFSMILLVSAAARGDDAPVAVTPQVAPEASVTPPVAVPETAKVEAAPVVEAKAEPAPPPAPAAAPKPSVFEPAPEPKKSPFTFSGSYRTLFWNQTDIPLSVRNIGDAPDLLGQTTFIEHRLRATAQYKFSDYTLDFEADVLNGLISPGERIVSPYPSPTAGAPRPDMADPLRNDPIGLSFDSFALRKAMLSYASNIGTFAVGVTSFSFGQGMLANDGAAPINSTLADQRFGDRVLRAFYGTKPLYYLSGGEIQEDVTSVIGVDLVLGDETGRLVNPIRDWSDPNRGLFRDTVMQIVMALKHSHGNYNGGLFATHRWFNFEQTFPLDSNVTVPFNPFLSAWAVDLTAEYRHPLKEVRDEKGDRKVLESIYVAGEGAIVTGTTNFVRNAACPGNTDEASCDVLQGGGVFRAGYESEGITVELLGGFASGDGNPFDKTVTNFRFDRDFKVGLIMFDQVVAWQSAGMVRRATDANVTNYPSAGVELLSTNGSITNALFFQPVVKYRPTKELQLTGAVVWAQAPQGLNDAFWMNRTSAKTNSFGQPSGSTYGLEIDGGADYEVALGGSLKLNVGVAGGYFMPGDAFVVDAAGNTMAGVYLAKLRAALLF